MFVTVLTVFLTIVGALIGASNSDAKNGGQVKPNQYQVSATHRTAVTKSFRGQRTPRTTIELADADWMNCRPAPTPPQDPPGFYGPEETPEEVPAEPVAPVEDGEGAILGLIITLLAGAAGAAAGYKAEKLDPTPGDDETVATPTITETK